MKKLLILSSLCAMFVGLSAFGQGFINFASGKSQTYYNLVPGGGAASTLDVSFLWGTANVTPAIATLTGMNSVPTSTPTNVTVAWGGANPVASAWTEILGDANYTLAHNQNANNAVPVQLALANGSFNYGNVALLGSSPGTIYLFEIAWLAAYGSTPAAAQSAGSPLGWGNVFSYSLVASTSTPGPISGANGFGTFLPIPEPSTLALAGLGGLSLLLFRRRK